VSLERPKPIAGAHEHRQMVRGRLGTGSLACPECDAPVHTVGALAASDALGCPFCGHAAVGRDFLSLAQPARPARVEVRVAHRAR
jgi:hypothetical protein